MRLNKGIIADINGSFKAKKPVEITLIVTLLIQMLIIIWFNLTSIKSHTGFDSSWSYLRAILMSNEKTLINPAWAEQNNFFLDSSALPAAILYGITHNIFISFGIANIVILLLIIWCLYVILSKMNLSFPAKLFALNIVICPYLTNGFDNHLDIGYFSNVISGAAHSSMRVLIALLIILEFIDISETRKFSIRTYITFALCLLTGASAGVFMLIMMILPYLLYELEVTSIKNKWSVLFERQAIFGYLCAIFIILGKILFKIYSEVEALDATRTWTVLESFWTNVGSVFLGFMKLLSVLPVTTADEVTILSSEGITRIYPIIIFAILVIGVVCVLRKVVKDLSDNCNILLFVLNIIVCNYITFSLFNVQYGQYVFEDRYLITTFFAAVIILAYFLNSLDQKQIFSIFLNFALLIAIIGNNIISDINYYVVENVYYTRAIAIDEYLDAQNDSDLVYVWGNDLVSLARVIRVYDTDRVYKFVKDDGGYYHWGDYTTYENNSDYTGVTYLIVDPAFDKAKPEVLEHYQLVQEYDGLLLYRCDSNPVDFSGL